jgi:ribosomal-protein-alanine N-acetyltransferase
MFGRSLRIRDFYAKDLETLHEIDRLCFSAEIAFSRRDLFLCLSQSGSIARIAEMHGAIVGFVLARIESSGQGHILTLDVVPDARRCGIGSMLMEDLHHCLKQREITRAVLEVGTCNSAAQCLYERLHYRVIGTLPGYYNGEQDAYRMRRLI